MLNLLDTCGMRLCDGFSRRDWLKVGSVALGSLSLPALLASQARGKADASSRGPSFGKAKSVNKTGTAEVEIKCPGTG